MKKYIFILLALGIVSKAVGQELEFNVTVVAPAIANADPKIFKTLEQEISNMINNNRWTDDTYQDHEKIKGQINLTITKENSATSFEAELSIIAARPIFNSTYTSQLIKYLDRNVAFSYDGVRPVEKSDNNYLDNLSSIMTYYMYFVLGTDYDSFSPLGDNPYFVKAFDVYTALPTSLQRGDSGWSPDDNTQQNRYFLLENVRNPSLKEFRSAFYEYHRLAMDKMHEDPDKARATLLSSLVQIGEAEKNYPRSILIRMFSDAKELEILEIFKPAAAGEKSKVSTIMSAINPLKASVYKNLR